MSLFCEILEYSKMVPGVCMSLTSLWKYILRSTGGSNSAHIPAKDKPETSFFCEFVQWYSLQYSNTTKTQKLYLSVLDTEVENMSLAQSI